MSKKILIIDSSTLISLERVDLIRLLDKIDYEIIIPKSVLEETGNPFKGFNNIKIEELSGNTLKISRDLQEIKIGEGESDCIALANKLGLDFILCDDRKLLRQIFFSRNNMLNKTKIIGFSFLLHEFYEKKLIFDIWSSFDKIIEGSNWKRSEVYTANRTFLKELGY